VVKLNRREEKNAVLRGEVMELKPILTKLTKHTPVVMGSESFSKYAVMLPLIQKNDGLYVLFETRSLDLRRQPGEICFPGGKIDSKDQDEKSAAIRETCEELGIEREKILDVYPLDFMISPFGMMVYPFVGLIDSQVIFQPNPTEVGDLFTVPLTYFLNTLPDIYHINFKVEPEENFPFDLIIGGENYNWRTRELEEYFYKYEEKAIWGLTAKILSHFVELIK
jgi:coenzyme A diphosphatase NUDT7